jgi:hypothetical protein
MQPTCLKASSIIGHSQSLNGPLQQGPNVLRRLLEARIIDRLHRCDRINGSNLGLITGNLLDDHIARQHYADLVFELQCFVRQLRIAGSENTVIAEINVNLLL